MTILNIKLSVDSIYKHIPLQPLAQAKTYFSPFSPLRATNYPFHFSLIEIINILHLIPNNTSFSRPPPPPPTLKAIFFKNPLILWTSAILESFSVDINSLFLSRGFYKVGLCTLPYTRRKYRY